MGAVGVCGVITRWSSVHASLYSQVKEVQVPRNKLENLKA